MKTSTALLIVGAAVVLGGIIFIVGSSSMSGEVEYNYSIDVQDSFISISGDAVWADHGFQFAIVSYHIYNRTYGDTISTSPMTWQMKVRLDGVEYSNSLVTVQHPWYNVIDVPKGSDGECVQVFQVPMGHAVDEIDITLDIHFTGARIIYNPDLPV